MLCARPLAFTELPHSPPGPETPQAPTITRPVATPAPTSNEDPPTTEIKPAPVVAPTPPPPTLPPVSGQPASEQAEVAAALASVVRILDDIVEQAVGLGITDAFARLERSHAQDLSALAERFEAALERQDKRHHELLERQDARLEELLTIHAKARAEALRAAHENTTIPAAIEELQETMRLGFGELRASLNQGNHELTRLRTECAALTSALSRLARPAEPFTAELRNGSPPLPSPPHPTPARSPPIREDRATAKRRLDALHDDNDQNDHNVHNVQNDPHDQPSRPLRYRPPDDDAEPSHAQEASA